MKNKLTENFTRRKLLQRSLTTGVFVIAANCIPTIMLAAETSPSIEHPLKKPKKYTDKGRCPNCGMMLNMWARTRHEFSDSDGSHTTCSIRCMADMSQNSGEKPKNGRVALYLHPEKMVAVTTASYVVGSSAKGTMTMKSKLAFASDAEAADFAKQYGGNVVPFATVLSSATKELSMSRPNIEKKRKKKGKIAEPNAETRCVVCGMYPARYPEHRCQISTKEGETQHFCSSQCMVSFLADPKEYVKKSITVKSVWVTVSHEQSYEYALGLYYLVGSQIMGPMGKEAIPYRSKAMAEKAAKDHGGRVVRYKELTPKHIFGSK